MGIEAWCWVRSKVATMKKQGLGCESLALGEQSGREEML